MSQDRRDPGPLFVGGLAALLMLGITGIARQESWARTVPPPPDDVCEETTEPISLSPTTHILTCVRIVDGTLNIHLAHSKHGAWVIQEEPLYQIDPSDYECLD